MREPRSAAGRPRRRANRIRRSVERSAPRLSLPTLFLFFAYALLLAYATLYPLGDWQSPSANPWNQMLSGWPRIGSALDLVINTLIYIPLGLLFVRAWFRSGGILAIFWAILAGASLSLVLEYLQAYSPGRVPSILDTALNALGSFLGASIAISLSRASELGRRAWYAVACIVVGAAVALMFQDQTLIERPLDESHWYRLPAPTELPPATLPSFQYSHPRLPAPTVVDIIRLQRDNPAFFRRHEERAKGGHGDFYSVILSSFVEPGSQDLVILHKRLMEQTFSWRGHQQAKPLALAYDWLYSQWSESQRVELRTKLVEGAEYLVHRIREEQRLSPYNVFLYNAPFQALVASVISVYGDDPSAEPAMRFTFDYWKNRVLPVWRQVMGANGGWHEGGGYVGIGIGSAIYQVPAMWRLATGEDLFATEPGIRGFLDFLVYRTRPDGSHFRWGDASIGHIRVPERIALAVEYGHKAAYSLHGCPERPTRTSWPWGPLPTEELCDPNAVARMPLAGYFDGLGLVVARSDWSPEATYVTFKTGDNYWSHSHLDQGAFTIYKGGALAIDSGIYGPTSGSDHHMNYNYQTIAHNTLTVTDPEDTVPGFRRGEPRTFANDGGQRRIGSGWGVEPAPLDRNEWESKREIYHTGRMEKVFLEEDLVVAVADVTPAYTNKYSGRGAFSHRTRRVERFWRTFGYDRLEDVIVIFDRVEATKPEFIKRWLLHTIEPPQLTDGGFVVTISPTDAPGHRGGRLYATVLLPRNPKIQTIGGPGFEYFVDGTNYDEGGKIAEYVAKKKRAEPGSWRIEISPSSLVEETVFLVVALPTLGVQQPQHRIQLLEEGERVGCEIVGSRRTTRWWFSPDRNGGEIEILEKGQRKSYDLTVAPRKR